MSSILQMTREGPYNMHRSEARLLKKKSIHEDTEMTFWKTTCIRAAKVFG